MVYSRYLCGCISTIALTCLSGTAWAAEAKEDKTQASDIIVTATVKRGVDKTGTPILKTPQDIEVISATLLKDQGISTLEDALRNLGGVAVGGYARAYDFFRIRGFEAWQYTQLDGLPRTVSLNYEPEGLEQVEVIKGPASVLYGRGAPGGLVNLVSKRPQPESFADFDVTMGSYDTAIATADINGSLNADHSIYARFNAVTGTKAASSTTPMA